MEGWKRFLLCVLLIVSFTAGVTAVVYYQKVVRVSWRVVNPDGIEVYPDVLELGDIERGKNATSSFNVTNVADTPLNVTITWIEAFCGCLVYVEPSEFILESGYIQTVTVTVDVGDIAELGDYNYTKLEITAHPI